MSETAPSAKPLPMPVAIGYTILVVLIWGLALTTAEAARPGAEGDLVTLTLCHALAHLTVLLVALRIHAPDEELREAFGLRPVGAPLLVLSAMLGACLYAPLAKVDAITAKRFPLDEETLKVIDRLVATPTIGSKLFLLASLVVAMPLVEELFFRGFIFGALRKGKGTGAAVVATTALFALARLDLRAIGSVCAIGLVLALVRARAGSALASLALHAGYSLVPLWPLVRGGEIMDDDLVPARVAWISLAAAAGIGATFVLAASRSGLARAARSRDT